MKTSKSETIPCEIDGCNGLADRTLITKYNKPDRYECGECKSEFDHDCRKSKKHTYYKIAGFYNGIMERLYMCDLCDRVWIGRVLGVDNEKT